MGAAMWAGLFGYPHDGGLCLRPAHYTLQIAGNGEDRLTLLANADEALVRSATIPAG